MFIRYNLPGFLWAIFILMLIGLPGKDIPDISFWALLTPDKIFHSGIFLFFVVLLIVGFRKQHSFIFLHYHAKAVALVTGILYSAITELLQMLLFTHRTADIMDFFANSIGCVLGLIMFRIIFGKSKSTATEN